MLFNSWQFLVLCVFTLGAYYLPVPGFRRKTWQVFALLVASSLFYAWEEPRLLILLFASCSLNAVAVERILFWKALSKEGRESGDWIESAGGIRAKRWLFGAVALNLVFLVFFKYSAFLIGFFPASWFSVACVNWLSGIPLPVGISFYTFQGISLVVDVWRNDISPRTALSLGGRGMVRFRSFRDTSFYIAFFPQLVAGPIVKAHEFVDQICSKNFADIDWVTVRRSLVVGYFLKIFVSDNLAEQTSVLALGAEHLVAAGPFDLMALLYGYSLQIFADFAGYSLIAIGLGELFGYKLPPNFNFPYLSCSITEFWRRWHLSLSAWLRDYLYIPLGGNRSGAGRTYFNLFLVMFLGGLWHGAAWKFALWGGVHGLFLVLERLAVGGRRSDPRNSCQERGSERHTTKAALFAFVLRFLGTGVSLLRWLLTFHIVTLLWLTFMMPDMASIVAFFKGVVSGRSSLSGPPMFSLVFYGSTVVVYHAWGWIQQHWCGLGARLAAPSVEGLVQGVMLFLVLTNPGAPQGFIYFQF